MSTSWTARRGVAAAAALALAGVLAGCSSHPGAAAVVDGRQIPSSDVQAALADLKPAAPSLTAQLVLQTLIQEPTLLQLARDEGVGVSDGDGKKLLDSLYTSAGVPAPASYAPATLVVGEHQAALTNLQKLDDIDAVSQEFADRLGELDVTVNPRFGGFEAGAVTAPTAPTWVVTATPK